jgi:hypothetical protein
VPENKYTVTEETLRRKWMLQRATRKGGKEDVS